MRLNKYCILIYFVHLVDSASILVRAVGTVGRLVAEKCFCNALTCVGLVLKLEIHLYPIGWKVGN